jgi:flagellum-specific ATP synthase
VLLGLITRQTVADVVVVGLIGERGREVREFIDMSLGKEGLQKAVLVIAPADESPADARHGHRTVPLDRRPLPRPGQARAAAGRFADPLRHGLREVALALGEPPATKGYPPSVFSALPQLVESAGNGENQAAA